MESRLAKLEYLFNPGSVAFIGATERLGKWGFIVFNNLITGGYEGKIYPVNPGRAEVLGYPAYPTVSAIPGEVDLAVFTVPATEVPAAVDDCIRKGVKAGVVISAGFRELGEDSAAVEREMVAKARAGGMVLVGPNGQGICCPRTKLFPWMPLYFYPPPGAVAVISQSGNVQGLLVDAVIKAGFGVSKGVSSGNEADLASHDYFAYLADDPDTEVILAYLEGVSDGRAFVETARAVSRKKPIVALKGGRTEAGSLAARSHTGSMAVSGRLFDAACDQAGVVRARKMSQAGMIAASFLNRPLPKGRRVGIITGGGGLGVIAADYCSEQGLEVVQLSNETLAKIQKMMPAWWVPGNPIDLVAGMNFHVVLPVIDILMRSAEVDSLLVLFIGPPRNKDAASLARNKQSEMLTKMWDSMGKMYGAFYDALYKLMREVGVPVYLVSNFMEERAGQPSPITDANRTTFYPTIETACLAIRAMVGYHEFREGDP